MLVKTDFGNFFGKCFTNLSQENVIKMKYMYTCTNVSKWLQNTK